MIEKQLLICTHCNTTRIPVTGSCVSEVWPTPDNAAVITYGEADPCTHIYTVLTVAVRVWYSWCFASYILRRSHGCPNHPCSWLWCLRGSSRATRQRYLLPSRTRQEIGLLHCVFVLGLNWTTLCWIYARGRIFLEVSDVYAHVLAPSDNSCIDCTSTSNLPLHAHSSSSHSSSSRSLPTNASL